MKGITKISYGLVIISLLLGSVLAPIPFAAADDDDDKRKKINDLKDKIKKIIEKLKCKQHKYEGICDKKDPDVNIIAPVKKDKLPTGVITIKATASDEDSGIKNVKVRINNGHYKDATLLPDGTWALDATLKKGSYLVTVKATDNAKNSESDNVNFKVIKI